MYNIITVKLENLKIQNKNKFQQQIVFYMTNQMTGKVSHFKDKHDSKHINIFIVFCDTKLELKIETKLLIRISFGINFRQN